MVCSKTRNIEEENNIGDNQEEKKKIFLKGCHTRRILHTYIRKHQRASLYVCAMKGWMRLLCLGKIFAFRVKRNHTLAKRIID